MILNNITLACQCRSIINIGKVLNNNNNNLRLCSTKNILKEKSKVIPPTEDSIDWITLYKFSHIRFAASLNKFKIYQTLATCIAVPGTFALETCNILPLHSYLVVAAVGVSSSMTLLIFGALSRNTIGFVYANDALDKVKLSYLNFWGRRENICFNTKNIILNTSKSRLSKFYIPVRTVNGDKVYRLFHRNGQIMNVETFSYIFGDEI